MDIQPHQQNKRVTGQRLRERSVHYGQVAATPDSATETHLGWKLRHLMFNLKWEPPGGSGEKVPRGNGENESQGPHSFSPTVCF